MVRDGIKIGQGVLAGMRGSVSAVSGARLQVQLYHHPIRLIRPLPTHRLFAGSLRVSCSTQAAGEEFLVACQSEREAFEPGASCRTHLHKPAAIDFVWPASHGV